MTLADILRHKGSSVVTVDGRTSMHQAIRILVTNNIGAVVVVQGERPRGILSERDVLHFLTRTDPELDGTRVDAVMTTELVTATAGSPISEAMSLMTEHRVRHLPIVEGDRLAGIVSIGDVVNALRSQVETENHHLKKYISTAG